MRSCINKIKRKVSNILWDTQMESVRISMFFGSLFWAILLAWPGTLFTPARTTYRLMSEIMNENMWALAFFTHAAFIFITLFCGKRNKVTFVGDAIIGCLLWTSATIACFASHWKLGADYAPPAAMSAELGLLFASWWWLVRWIVDTNGKITVNGRSTNCN